MKKLLILALASAFVAAANADNPNQFGVASTGLSNAEWKQDNQTVERAYTGSVISIDEEASSPLVLSPTTGFTAPDPQVKTVVTVVAQFDTINNVDELAEPGEGAKTAFTVANVSGTPRYRYWDGDSWEELDDAVTAVTNSAITIKIELDNSTPDTTTAAFKVGDAQIGQTVTISASTETTLGALAFVGTGTLTSVDATVTPAYATTETKRYASVSAAFDDNVAVADMTLHKYVDSFGDMPSVNDKLYFPASVNGNTARLYSFNKVTEDNVDYYQITSAADLKALVDLTAYDNTALALNFKQTANITLDAAWPGIGIQNGKDLAYDKDTTEANIAAYDAGAFQGTYDGCNYTISNFKMDSGLDYCGFFNSTKDATIKNLTIEYAGNKFTDGSASNSSDCGATFVGVTKNTTLENLTANMPNGVEVVQSGKGIGGIVGYLANNSTVRSCTNNVNLQSLANNKVGGIAMICQQQGCSISNCKNTGTMSTGSGEFGGIIGYTDTITISDCENTAACKMFYHHGGTVTLSGTNKGNATVASYTGVATPGLNFATVSDDVATFVADTALEAGKTYKVMATGATATYAFTAAGSISFDTSLATPTTYAIASSTLKVTCAPDGENKVTYTAAVPEFTIEVPDNTVVTVGNEEFTTDAQLSMPYGTEVTITYTPADGYIGESKTQKITVAGDTETISAPSTYVAPVPAVAKIGTTYYATLAEALANADNGDKVTLLDNVTLAEPLNVTLGNKAVTLDLGAKTLTGRTNLKSGSLTIQNGTVAGGSQQALNVYGSADSAAQNYSVLTIVSGVNVTADVYGVCMFGATAGSNGYGAVVNIEGTVTTTGDGKNGAVFVSGNLGKNVSGDAHNVINVTGTITSSTDAAIALNGLATVNVKDGATVTGNTAIAVKRGTLNIQGGMVYATGEKNYPGTPNYNGTEMTGAAISVSDTYSQYGAMGANVTGGTITSDNADAIYKKDGDYKADAPIAVSGGTFSSSVPVEFCAAEFIPAGPDATTGKYGVEAGWKITWVVDGVKTVNTVKNGENLTQPTDPAKSGYEFKGWTPDVVVKPVADATYTAQWEQTAVPVVSTAETTLVAVPADCTAATLIDLSNRAAGDELKVYVSSVGKYYAWKLTGTPLAWSPMNVASGEGASATVEESPAADTVPLRRGQAAWVTRTTSSNILLKGQYSADDLTVSVEKGWNLVAPTTEESFSLNSITPPNDGDKIVVPQTTALRKIYTYDATKKQWGYTDSRKIDSFKGKDVVETFINYEDATIPVGTGFWYVTDANEDVQLQKKGNE